MEIRIRNIKYGDCYWMDKSILYVYGKELKLAGIAVYNVLASYAHFRTQVSYSSQKAIADILRISRRTVARKLKQLQELALIVKPGPRTCLLLAPSDMPESNLVLKYERLKNQNKESQ